MITLKDLLESLEIAYYNLYTNGILYNSEIAYNNAIRRIAKLKEKIISLYGDSKEITK